jgi:hypothetical protein
MTTLVKDGFRNDSGGVAGAIIIENNQTKAVPVQPDDMIWLTEDEQALTANAPKHGDNNPFINGTFTLVTEAVHIKHARPLVAGEPPEGSRAPGEEVATPAAVSTETPETEIAHDGRSVVKRKNPTA